ncbi:hypothetical protein [Haloplanus pelagicus]|uniref:hypothetical protein n=1 Tax=Haloplanus pelagicus TaxID=2949995 RepID=UPI0020419D01|nr:hypothetical protein [Haloplanus sp. HW8-1]
MTLDCVRAAAIDRALVGDDPETALALAGAVDAVGTETVGDPIAATMLAVGSAVAAIGRSAPPATDRSGVPEGDRSLDELAWIPGRDTDPFVLAGAAVAVESRDLAVDRAADLAGCSRATLGAVVERREEL